MFTGEGDEILVTNEGAGFGADDKEDIGAVWKPGGLEFMSKDGLPSD